jgi:hypothetical protein
VWTFAVTALVTTACGARTGLLVPLPDGGAEDVVTCNGTPIPLDTNAPDLYFVLDGSGSMQEDGKWPNMRAAIANLITQLGPRARFGAAIFPTQGESPCAVGSEVMPVQTGDSQGVTANVFLAATSLTPVGGTPTAATLSALTPELTSFPQVTFAILATDGGPNCDPALSCDASTCTSNMDGVPGCPVGGPPNCCDPTTGLGGEGCLDGAAATQAVSDLRNAGVLTFVMGIPGSAPYAAVLDELALAGGVGRATEPYYYAVDTADTDALGDALAQIAARATASCIFTLAQLPAEGDEVNVYVGGALVPRDGGNGWTLVGTKLTLLGATCNAIETGHAVSVTVLEGCATVTQ